MLHFSKSLPVRRISPEGEHFFFGYYDLQPFNADESLHLTHRSAFRNRLQCKEDSVEVGFIEMGTGKYQPLDTTYAWNFQQGAMLQWNPQAPDREVIYNTLMDGQQRGVIMDIYSGQKRYLDRPVANVSRDGKYALSINMSRLYNFRPGYGYAFPEDAFYYKNHDANDGVFLIDMETGRSKLVLSMQQIWDFSGSFFQKDEKMIINHITFNPDASRFVALVRNFPAPGQRHMTALITANRDGSDLYLLSDYGVQSHYYWLNNRDIVFYNDGKELPCQWGWCNNYILTDQTHEGKIMAEGFWYFDNHMSFTADGKLMITDTYPDQYQMQPLQLYHVEKNICANIGRFYSMPNVVTDVRCDLHPRWSRTGKTITFDSTHESFRGIYQIELPEDVDAMFDQNLIGVQSGTTVAGHTCSSPD